MPPATADAVVEANEKSRIDGLRAAVAILALLTLVALLFTRGIPTAQPGSRRFPSRTRRSPLGRGRPVV